MKFDINNYLEELQKQARKKSITKEMKKIELKLKFYPIVTDANGVINADKITDITLYDLCNRDVTLRVANADRYKLFHSMKTKHFILCMQCHTHRGLQIHHKDKDYRNNKICNLILLCKACGRKKYNSAAKPFNYCGGGSRAHGKYKGN